MANNFIVENNINEYVKYYSRRILEDVSFYKQDEAYKYEAVSTFQKYFDLEAQDIVAMLENSLSKARNLIQSGQYYPKRMLIRFANKNPEYIRSIFKKLFKEDTPVEKRIDEFIEKIHSKFPLVNEQYYIDARFLSFFLAANMPSKYFYVKTSEYKRFAGMVGYEMDIRGKHGEKYGSMHDLAVITKSFLKNNKDFIKVHKIITKSFEYKDPTFSWGTFDFIFDVARREGGQLEFAKNKINWQTKVVNSKTDSGEDLLAEEGLIEETKEKSKSEILQEAIEFKPKDSEGYFSGVGKYKKRIDNVRQKNRVKILEDYACQVCNFTFEFKDSEGRTRKYAEVDHIIEKSDGGTEELDNLWVLCPNCHIKKTLGVIKINKEKRIVTENGKDIIIRDNHLGWN